MRERAIKLMGGKETQRSTCCSNTALCRIVDHVTRFGCSFFCANRVPIAENPFLLSKNPFASARNPMTFSENSFTFLENLSPLG